jgi:DNA-binding protein HU-beta
VALNRSQLVEEIATTTGLTKRQAEEAVDSFVVTIGDQVRSGNKVTIYGFGSFNPTARKARTGRNPRTGQPVKIAASKGIRFSPATGFKADLNAKKSAAKKTAAAKAAGRATTTRATKATKTTTKAATTKAPGRKSAAAVKATSTRSPGRPAKATKAVAATTTKKATAAKVPAKKATAKAAKAPAKSSRATKK